CFYAAIEATRIALKYRTPVILLSDGYLANSSEPWRLPDVESLPAIDVPFASEPNHDGPDGTRLFWPYERDPDTLARPWAVQRTRARGKKVAQAHLVHLNPFPPNLGEVLRRYPKVLIPELNLGQLSKLVRADFLVDARSLTKVQAQPFKAAEIEQAIVEFIDE